MLPRCAPKALSPSNRLEKTPSSSEPLKLNAGQSVTSVKAFSEKVLRMLEAKSSGPLTPEDRKLLG